MSQSVLRRNLGFMAGLIALSSVVACSDDTTSPSGTEDAGSDVTATDSGGNHDAAAADVVTNDSTSAEAAMGDSGMEAAMGDSGMEAAMGDGGMEAAMGDGGMEAAMGDGGMEAAPKDGAVEAAMGDGGGDAAAKDGATEAAMGDAGLDGATTSDAPEDVTVVGDAGQDVTVVGDAGQDVTVSGDTGSDVMMGGDGGGTPDVAVVDASDGAVVAPALACTFGEPDAGPPCIVSGTAPAWQLKKWTLEDGGAPPTLTVVSASDAGPGGLAFSVPFTGPGQSAEMLLWTDLPAALNVAGKTLSFTVQGLVPFTSDPGNPGSWDFFFQSETQPDGNADWPYDWVGGENLSVPDGGVGAFQTIVLPLSGLASEGVDLTKVVTVGFDITSPAATAVDAGVTYSTANILISNITIE